MGAGGGNSSSMASATVGAAGSGLAAGCCVIGLAVQPFPSHVTTTGVALAACMPRSHAWQPTMYESGPRCDSGVHRASNLRVDTFWRLKTGLYRKVDTHLRN